MMLGNNHIDTNPNIWCASFSFCRLKNIKKFGNGITDSTDSFLFLVLFWERKFRGEQQ